MGGNKLLEIRNEEEHVSKHDDDMPEIAALQERINESEKDLQTLEEWFENIERHMKTLEETLEYLERSDQKEKGPPPSQGVLETIEEVKGSVRRKKIEPLLQHQEEVNRKSLSMPDRSELTKLEKTRAELEKMLKDIGFAAQALPPANSH